MFIDAHAHLDPRHFPGEADAVLARAFEAGVEQLLVVGLGQADGEHALALARAYPGRVFAALAVHPHDAADMTEADFDALAALAREPEVVAIGEAGLDYHYDHSPREVQREVFARFCALAKALNKPLVVHTREAEADTVAILQAQAPFPAGGQLHSFTGTWALARPALELGFHVSFSGVLTFNNADPLREVARGVPIDRLLVETDCPYLTPAPFRGRKNEPMFVPVIGAALGALHGLSWEAMAQHTSENARRLFCLPPPPAAALLAFADSEALYVRVDAPEADAARLLEAAARWPLKKVRRVVLLGDPRARPDLTEAVRGWAREHQRELV